MSTFPLPTRGNWDGIVYEVCCRMCSEEPGRRPHLEGCCSRKAKQSPPCMSACTGRAAWSEWAAGTWRNWQDLASRITLSILLRPRSWCVEMGESCCHLFCPKLSRSGPQPQIPHSGNSRNHTTRVIPLISTWPYFYNSSKIIALPFKNMPYLISHYKREMYSI